MQPAPTKHCLGEATLLAYEVGNGKYEGENKNNKEESTGNTSF
jgi:hypothetical protein